MGASLPGALRSLAVSGSPARSDSFTARSRVSEFGTVQHQEPSHSWRRRSVLIFASTALRTHNQTGFQDMERVMGLRGKRRH